MVVNYFKEYGHLPVDQIKSEVQESNDDPRQFNTEEKQKVSSLKDLLNRIQDNLSLSNQDADRLLNLFLVSDATLNVIETIYKSCSYDKYEFCGNIEEMLMPNWDFQFDVKIVTDVVFQHVVESHQTLRDVLFKALIKCTDKDMEYVKHWTVELCNKFIHIGMNYTKLQETYLAARPDPGMLTKVLSTGCNSKRPFFQCTKQLRFELRAA